MRMALINGSPRGKQSGSATLLDDFKKTCSAEVSFCELQVNKPTLSDQQLQELKNCSTWIFAFPLYVDGIPSHLLSCLQQLEKSDFEGEKHRVYALVNCGFYEGDQNRHAIDMMEIWCEKSGLAWGMGIGLGGGGALTQMKNVPLGKGPKRTLEKALSVMRAADLAKRKGITLYISLDFPRFLYKWFAEAGWRKRVKANGGTVRDLKRRL